MTGRWDASLVSAEFAGLAGPIETCDCDCEDYCACEPLEGDEC